MNYFMNSAGEESEHGLKIIHKTTEMTTPPPSDSFVFIDEREDSIQDSAFIVDMWNHPAGLASVPQNGHGGSGTISFADGHVEKRKWIDPRTNPTYQKDAYVWFTTVPPDNLDIFWLRPRTAGRN